MTTLSWVQPPDMLAHELVASADEGRQIDDIRRRWESAGGQVEAPRAGVGQHGDASLRALALDLLDELEVRPLGEGLSLREPDDLAAIEATWEALPAKTPVTAGLEDRLHGAWLGRAAGCLLGKPVEKIPRHGIREILQSQGRWPLEDWFTARGLPEDVAARWPWNRRSAPNSLAENIDGMPEDDDLNFAMLALQILETHGHDFSTDAVADAWLASLPGGRVFTAERVAYRNLLLGEQPPRTAIRHNPYRDWIGALIRADVYGWTSPGDPASAARTAWLDARLSHVRNGVYGAMFAAAMCAQSVVCDDMDKVIDAGLAVIPPRSRLAVAVGHGVRLGRSDTNVEEALDELHERYGHLHWVHVLNNAALLGFALARSQGDLQHAICISVTGGWDTDSVGATAGSICGGLAGVSHLPSKWVEPLRNRIASSLPGFDQISFEELADRTVKVVRR